MRFVLFEKDLPWIHEELEMAHNQSFGKYRSLFSSENISASSTIRVSFRSIMIYKQKTVVSHFFRFALFIERVSSLLECRTVPMSISPIQICTIIGKRTLKKVGRGGSIISVGEKNEVRIDEGLDFRNSRGIHRGIFWQFIVSIGFMSAT